MNNSCQVLTVVLSLFPLLPLIHLVHAEEKPRKPITAEELRRSGKVPPDWTVTRQQFREPLAQNQSRKFYEVVNYRLICDPQAEVVEQDQPIRLRVGVVNVADAGESMLNPFIDDAFPRSLRIAVFDESNQFVGLLPRQEKKDEVDEESTYEFHKDEMRGKFVDVSTNAAGDKQDPFYISLKPGRYKFQLVACGRFFFADLVHALEQDINKVEAKWQIALDLEVARSAAASVRVIERGDATAKLSEKPTQGSLELIESDWPKLLSVVTINEKVAESAQKVSRYFEVSLTLTNTSTTNFIGAIDPFLWLMGQDDPPIAWTVREFGKPDRNPHKAPFGHRWACRRSDFIILPPQGIASCTVYRFPRKPGRFEVSVDLKRGIVIDPQKLDYLERGDPLIGLRMGGVDAKTIHPASILSRKIVIE